ncbi:MAG: hypothetical protein QGF15_04380 [Alteromonas macleodii]|jgi:hypothetical protein|nr:hypothetical protein [Alteromonas macleodii]|tara:strand:+ start:11584 stop:12300 length:717 start_codon:yes stop_codon:yes gene_type:complete
MAVHFTGPILFAGKDSPRKWFENLPVDKNPDYVTFMDDFTGIALDTTNDWTVVKDSSATAALGADAESGTLVLTSQATTDDDGSSVQGNEIFAVESGRDIWFETRIKVGDSEGSAIDLCVGLTVNFATNPEAMLTAADRIVFQVDDGDTNIDCITEKDGTATTTDSGVDIADDTYVKLGFHVTDDAKVEFFVNRNLVATHTDNIPDDENMTIGAMELSGSATGTKSATIDYLFCSQTR